MTKTARKTTTSAQAHADFRAEAIKSLRLITAALDAQQIAQPHWGHVGDMAAIAAGLRTIAESLTGTGEFAK